MILLIDNYDSFTYNLYQYIGELYHDIQVVRNDEITIEQIEEHAPAGADPFPWSRLSEGRRHHHGGDSSLQRQDSHAGCLPGTSVHLRGIRRHDRPGSASDARQGKPDGAGYHKPHFRRTAENSFLRQISFSDCPGIGFSGVLKSNSTG